VKTNQSPYLRQPKFNIAAGIAAAKSKKQKNEQITFHH
jgi:hypothetical protein